MRLNRQAAKRWISFQTTLTLFGLGLLCWFVPSAWGANLDFARIKSQLVSPESHPLARQASQIYQKLLPAWDSHRSPPELYVADVNEEILALSLQDGGILLSTAAIKLCLNAGPNGNSFLAFVLAHVVMLRAFDKGTGREVGAVYMPAPQTGSPMTYMAGGRQYLVVAIAGAGYSGELVAFRLPTP